MKILIDTHYVVAHAADDIEQRYPDFAGVLRRPEVEAYVSVASLWEIAIKSRLGKLEIRRPLDVLEAYLLASGVLVLPVATKHVVASIDPPPATKDPFDRLLLGVCATEGMRLATIDRSLADHPLALRA